MSVEDNLPGTPTLKTNPRSRRVPSQAEEKLLGKFLFKCCIRVSLDIGFSTSCLRMTSLFVYMQGIASEKAQDQ